MDTLGDALPREMKRCRKLAEEYAKIGPVGVFGLTHINASLEKAEEALASGDLVAMIGAYQELKEKE